MKLFLNDALRSYILDDIFMLGIVSGVSLYTGPMPGHTEAPTGDLIGNIGWITINAANKGTAVFPGGESVAAGQAGVVGYGALGGGVAVIYGSAGIDPVTMDFVFDEGTYGFPDTINFEATTAIYPETD